MQHVTVEINGRSFDNIERAFADLGDRLEQSIDKAAIPIGKAAMAMLQLVAAKMEQRHGNPWAGTVKNPTPFLQSRTGKGLRSIRDSIKVATSSGQEMLYASISAGDLSFHEKGGVVRAKRAQYLTIPLPAAMDSRGVPLRKRARDWDNTFVRRSRRGNLIVFRKLPSANEVTPLYVLKPSVYIPPRLGMQAVFEKDGLTYFEIKALDEIANMFDRSL